MESEKKQSKYFKDAGDTAASKYHKTAPTKSKYIKSEEDRKQPREEQKADKNVRQSAARLNATHRYATQEETANAVEDVSEEISEAAEEVISEVALEEAVDEDIIEEPVKRKGSSAGMFTEQKADARAQKYYKQREIENTTDDGKKVILRLVLCTTVLTAMAVVLQFANFRFAFMPSFLNIDLSALPELIVSLAYGPVLGVVTVLVKNIVRVIFVRADAISCLSNLVMDSVFIFVAGYLYARRMFTLRTKDIRNYHRNRRNGKKPKDLRTRRIVLSSLIGAVATSVVSFFFTKFVSYPLFIKVGADYGAILSSYQRALDNINAHLPAALAGKIVEIKNLSQGILLFNTPITIVKFVSIALVVSLTYKYISPFLHFRPKDKPNKKKSKKK